MSTNRFVENLVKGTVPVFYHMVVVLLSATIALSLPYIVQFMAKNFLTYWTIIGNEKVFLIMVEMTLAIFLILISHYIRISWKDRKLANMARNSGLLFVSLTRGLFTRRKTRKIKEEQGFGRDIMLMCATGFNTFVDPKSDLHEVVRQCREAKIVLMNPEESEVRQRSKSIPDPDFSPTQVTQEVIESIHFLKELQLVKKNIKLKLYQDPPFLKLEILGDYLWMQYYHMGLNVRIMPEFTFQHNQNPGSLYKPFYQYFLTSWYHPDIPEYDFITGELIYRDLAGNEVKRAKFDLSDREENCEVSLKHPSLCKRDERSGYETSSIVGANNYHLRSQNYYSED